MSKECLVTGASSQLGAPVMAGLMAAGFIVTAWSRQPAPPVGADSSAVQWQQAAVQQPPTVAASTQLLVHLAPIDLLPALLAAATLPPLRIIAISTCSIRFKAQSDCPHEQRLAADLLAAEQQAIQQAREQGHQLTVLRSSMLYGAGRDGTIAVLQSFVHRFGFLILPAGATGLRQPVHVADIAQAVLACVAQPNTIGKTYELGGADRLTLSQLAERVFTHNNRRPRIYSVPQWLLRGLIAVVRWSRVRGDWRPGLVARAQQAQVVDNSPAQHDFAYAPRLFDGRFVVGTQHGAD